jgi:hypothetical protein
VVWCPLGAIKNDGPAFQTYDTGEARLSIGANYMTNQDSSGLNPATVGADTRTAGVDALFLCGPLSVTGELISRDEHDKTGVNDDDDGYLLEGGWLLTDRWELAVRQAGIDYEVKDDRTERAVGVNYYVDKHNGKWQLEWNQIDAQGVTPSQTLWRVGYQLMF